MVDREWLGWHSTIVRGSRSPETQLSDDKASGRSSKPHVRFAEKRRRSDGAIYRIASLLPTIRPELLTSRFWTPCLFHGYRSKKPLARARNGFNEAWIVGIVVESGLELFQNDVQTAVEINVSPFRPKLLPQFLPSNDFAVPL